MFPRLFTIADFSLPTYGVLVAAGLITGLLVAVRLAERDGIDGDNAWNLGILAILSAIVGAKLLLVVNDWERYSAHPREIFSFALLQSGGIFYGGLLAALAASFWYMHRRRMPALRTADAFAPGIALGHGIGRLGCFAAGCCYGKQTELPWGVTFTNPLAHAFAGTPLNVPLHPTQLYEFAVELANFFLLYWLFQRRRFAGQVLGAYLFLYGVARFFLDFLRDDPTRTTLFNGTLALNQLISILLVIAGGALWLRRETTARPAPAGVA